VEKSGN